MYTIIDNDLFVYMFFEFGFEHQRKEKNSNGAFHKEKLWSAQGI